MLNTALDNDDPGHGNIGFIVITTKSEKVIGLTRNSVVTVFNNIDG
ncbi:MAG: hypothetical protein V1915_02910 [Candidatus Bathyarchaeota archaeon]